MNEAAEKLRFETKLLCPDKPGKDSSWGFLILPKNVSDKLPRSGRTTVEGTINVYPLRATLEPDGRLSHWLRVGVELRKASDLHLGSMVTLEIFPVKKEPEPRVPDDLSVALAACPEAKEVWDDATTVAFIDWIHWIESAKQLKTRKRHIDNACGMLASGKRRACCFDSSGFYSKSLSAPHAAD